MSGKAENLSILAKNGFRVPKGFVLDSAHYKAAITPIMDSMMAALPNAGAVRALVEELELSAGTLEVLVLDKDGKPIPKIEASLFFV